MLKIGKLVIQLFGVVIRAENIQVSKIPVGAGAVLVFLAIVPTMALLIFR